jgi:PilX N-terminal
MNKLRNVHPNQPLNRQPDREGFALVTTLLIVLVLSVLAVAVAWMATSEKKISFAEGVHISSVYSADAGGEAGINFLRMADSPPHITDYTDNSVLNIGETAVLNSQTFEFDCFYDGKSPRPGWGVEFMDYDYRVSSTGRASTSGESQVTLVASRLFKEGY